MKNKTYHIIIIILLVLFCAKCSNNINCSKCENIFLDHTATANITYITDGDTYKTTVQNETIIIRLLDIDCFETRHTERLKEQAEKKGITEDSAYNLGLQAKQLATDKLLNKTVTLKRDSTQQNIDVYGRILRHVVINDSMFSDMLKDRKLNAME